MANSGPTFRKNWPTFSSNIWSHWRRKVFPVMQSATIQNSILHISEILLFHLFCIRSCQIMNDCYLFLLAGWLAGVGQQRLTQKCKEPLSLYLSLFLPLFPSILLYILFTLSFILYLLLSISSLLLSLLLSLSFSVDLDHWKMSFCLDITLHPVNRR